MMSKLESTETVRGTRISRLAKLPPFYHDRLRSLNKEKGQSFEFDRREEG